MRSIKVKRTRLVTALSATIITLLTSQLTVRSSSHAVSLSEASLSVAHENGKVRLVKGRHSVATLASRIPLEADGVASSVMLQGKPAVFSSVTERLEPNGPKVLSSVASSTDVTLFWPTVPTASMYRVYKNDQLLGQTSKNSFKDVNIIPGTTYQYSLETVVARSSVVVPKGVVAPNEGSHVSRAPGPVPAVRNAGAAQEVPSATLVVKLSAPVRVPASASSAAVDSAVASTLAAAAVATKTRFRHTTFIAAATAPGWPCNVMPPNTYFGGDNRSWSEKSSRFRTRLDANINWVSRKVTQSKNTGDTKLFNNNGTLREVKNAGIDAYDLYIVDAATSSRVTVRAEHDAKNPFCANVGAAITYHWQATIYRDNRIYMVGDHDRAPDHEVYLNNFVTPSWAHTRHELFSFNCLVPGYCSKQSF